MEFQSKLNYVGKIVREPILTQEMDAYMRQDAQLR